MGEPQFFSFRRPPDWRRGSTNHLSVSSEGLSILRKDVYRTHRRYTPDHPSLVYPVKDAALSRTGGWLLLDGAGTVWKADVAGGYLETLLPAGHGWFSDNAAVAALSDFWVVADAGGVPTVAAFSAHNAQLLWGKSNWDGEPFRCIAVAADEDDHVLALAEFAGGAYRILRFGASGNEAGTVELVLPEDVEVPENEAAGHRFDLAADAGSGYLLDRYTQQVARFSFSSSSAEFTPLPSGARPSFAICRAEPNTYWVAKREGAARFVLRLDEAGNILERGAAGAGEEGRLMAIPGRGLYVWDASDSSVTSLHPRPETAVWEPFGRRLGVWISDSLDSKTAGTEWHKVVLDAKRDPDTQIRVRYYASDRKEAAIGGEWVDLDRYITDDAIPTETKLEQLAPLWSEPIVDPEDALLVRAKGRYLWVSLELIGSESHTPVVHGLQLHFPRSSYIHYLPALYQEDDKSKDFLERFLSLFQTLMDETDERIKQVPRSFDPDAATGDSLRWLLGWIGLSADDHWSEEQLRKLLRAAPYIHKLRGTRYALETLITIYTGDPPIILEYDHLKPFKENPELEMVAEQLYTADPHGFNVLVKLEHADTETKRVTLQHLIDSFKPAFTTGRLVVLQPWVYMDVHSYLGLNTVLSEPALLKLDGLSSMPHHTITIDVDQDNRVDQHTRLGLDSRLE